MNRIAFLFLLLALGGALRADSANAPAPNPYQLYGIGAVCRDVAGKTTIVKLLPLGPAANAGFQPNDQIVQVDGTNTTGMRLADVVHLLRGPKGTDVTVVIQRPGAATQITVTLTRAPIAVPVRLATPGNGAPGN